MEYRAHGFSTIPGLKSIGNLVQSGVLLSRPLSGFAREGRYELKRISGPREKNRVAKVIPLSGDSLWGPAKEILESGFSS